MIGGTIQGENVDNLYEPDFLFMMMWHRVNSFINFPMKLPWRCPECETDNNDQLDSGSASFRMRYPRTMIREGIRLNSRVGFHHSETVQDGRRGQGSQVPTTGLGQQRVDEDTVRKAEIVQMMEYDTNFNPMEKWEIVNKAFTVENTFMIEGFRREFAYGPATRQVCNCNGCGGQQNVGFRFSLCGYSEFLPLRLLLRIYHS